MRLLVFLLTLTIYSSYSQSSSLDNDPWDKEYWATDDSYLTKGDNYFKQKMFFEAIQIFNKSIEINNKNYWAYLLRGSAKSQIEDNRGAIVDLVTAEEILNLDKQAGGRYSSDYKSHLSYIYSTRGITYLKLKEKKEGCLWLSKAGELGARSAYDAIQQWCR